MAKSTRKVTKFLRAMWRRRVLQIMVPYAVTFWLLIQITELVVDVFELPLWIIQALIILFVLAFPAVLALTWTLEFRAKNGPQQLRSAEIAGEQGPPLAISLEMGRSERRQVSMLSGSFDIAQLGSEETSLEYLHDILGELEVVSRTLGARFDAYRLPTAAEKVSFVFGYPQAHDDDARRAVTAGLAIIDEVGRLNQSRADLGEPIVVARVGIHTGVVVVEESPEGKQRAKFIGQIPRLANSLRDMAPASTTLISSQTRDLTGNGFLTAPHDINGLGVVDAETKVFRVKKVLRADLNLWQEQILIGRNDELHLLESKWHNVVHGEGQFVLLQGSPGIGKSALIRRLSQLVIRKSSAWIFPCYCSPYEKDTSLFPIIRALQEAVLGFAPWDSEEERFKKLCDFVDQQEMDADQSVSLLAELLSLPVERSSPVEESPQIIRIRTLELLSTMIRTAAEKEPVLIVIEDLQWADPTTLEWILMMVNQGASPGVFMLLSARSEFVADWANRSSILNMTLSPLSQSASKKLIAVSTGSTLPLQWVNRIITETEGNPLYIQEVSKGLLESSGRQLAFGEDGVDSISHVDIPATLQDSLAARVDSLGEAKTLLQLCSVLGREFSFELLRKVACSENEAALTNYLNNLVKAEMLFQRGSYLQPSYEFKHILIQESAYHSLLKSTRKELHERIALVIEKEYPELAKRQPARLAHHFVEAGQPDKAISYHTIAASLSLDRFANPEAIEQARQGLALLAKKPMSPQRIEQELPLQAAMGKALLATYGYSHKEGRQAFERALELCEHIGDAPQLFQMLVGLWMYYVISARFDTSIEICRRLLRISESTGDPVQFLQANYCMGYTRFYKAQFPAAQRYLERALESEKEGYDYSSQSATEDDSRIPVRVILALVYWHLGQPVTAARCVNEANNMAQELKHPFGITFAAFVSAWFHQMRGDTKHTADYAAKAAAIAKEKRYEFWVPLSTFLGAWAVNKNLESARSGDTEDLDQLDACLTSYLESGAGAGQTYLTFSLAETCINQGDIKRAKEALNKAWAAVESTGEKFFVPEYQRLMGLLYVRRIRDQSSAEHFNNAEACFNEAMRQARGIGSCALELRAANDLAELMFRKGRYRESVKLLSAVSAKFKEFDDSADCVRAMNLLKKSKKRLVQAGQ